MVVVVQVLGTVLLVLCKILTALMALYLLVKADEVCMVKILGVVLAKTAMVVSKAATLVAAAVAKAIVGQAVADKAAVAAFASFGAAALLDLPMTHQTTH